MLQIYPVLCRAGKMDNYSYILHDDQNNVVAVIDPSENAPIISRLQALGLNPQYIMATHHHYDHTDGIIELKEMYGCRVIGNINDAARIPGFDLGVEAGKTYSLSPESLILVTSGTEEAAQTVSDFTFEVIDASAHTQGHILYYFPAAQALFTGDTLFNLCIGGLFEGTIEEMYAALAKIRGLPEDVVFYPGHEYTLSAAPQAWQYFKGDKNIRAYLQRAETRLNQALPVAPVSLKDEKKCNPYLHSSNLQEFKSLFE